MLSSRPGCKDMLNRTLPHDRPAATSGCTEPLRDLMNTDLFDLHPAVCYLNYPIVKTKPRLPSLLLPMTRELLQPLAQPAYPEQAQKLAQTPQTHHQDSAFAIVRLALSPSPCAEQQMRARPFQPLWPHRYSSCLCHGALLAATQYVQNGEEKPGAP